VLVFLWIYGGATNFCEIDFEYGIEQAQIFIIRGCLLQFLLIFLVDCCPNYFAQKFKFYINHADYVDSVICKGQA